MKKILALSFAFAAFTMSVSAQEKQGVVTDKKGKIERSHQRGQNGMKDLNLSETQKSQLKAIHEDKSLSKEDRKAKMNNIFTADQKNQLAQKRAGMEGRSKEMHEKKDQQLQSKLGLNNEQASRLKTLNAENHAKMKALKDNQSLGADAKKAQMNALRESAKQQRKSILTADQQKKMDEMKKDRKGKHHKNKHDKQAK